MKKALLALFLAAAVLAAGCALNFHFGAARPYQKSPALADYTGEVRVPGLSGEAHIYRDQYGVPHIFADNDHDLFFAAGWAQAQDRLFEMVLMRAIAEGRTAELFGEFGVPGLELAGMPLGTVALDQHMRKMGMKYMGDLGAALLKENDPRVYAQLQAFADGVNYYIKSLKDEDLPVEFRILKLRPEPMEVRDIFAFGRFIGSILAANMPVELARHAAIKKYGPELGWKLFPLYPGFGRDIVPADLLKNKLAAPRDIPPGGRPSDAELGFTPALSADAALNLADAFAAVRSILAVDDTIGSNNWAATGKMTESGRAILANDPHLQHLEPSLFYMMHIKGGGYDAMGVTFPGNPFIVLGHTRRLAWGATTSRADVQDLFVETTDDKHPGKYLYKGEWLPFVERREIIRVRVGNLWQDREFVVRQTVHGPVMNEPGKGEPPLAMRWTGWDLSRDPRVFQLAVSSGSVEEFMQKYRALSDRPKTLSIVAAIERLNRGEKLDDFIAAMDLLDLPNQNWIAADDAGRIAYLPGGLVPLRGKGIGVLPVPGASGEFDWTGFVPLMELPHLIDPERGWVATANNRVVDPQYYPYVFSTHHGEPWRGMRIEQLIDELKPLSVEDMKRIQNDVKVERAAWLLPQAFAAVEGREIKDPGARQALAELKAWDFESDIDSTATVVFFEFLDALYENTFADEVDKATFKGMHIEGYSYIQLDVALANGDPTFFDDRRTKPVENLGDMVEGALADAMAKVAKKWGSKPEERRWGDIHMMKWYHLLGIGPAADMSVGPFPHAGAPNTVRNAAVANFGKWPYKTMTGACLRHIMDMGRPDEALMIIDGSQSGQWLSPHYRDLHEVWLRGEYITADMDEGRVKQSAKYHQTLRP